MRKPNFCIPGCIAINSKLFFITCLGLLFAFSAKAQLPVNLKFFKARMISLNKAEIFWTTEYEKDNGHFDIESSVDGVNFTVVAKVPGANQHGVLTDYLFYDNNALKGISYYRLKQVDVDGAFLYSHIEKVGGIGAGNVVYVYPNPAMGGTFKIDLAKKVAGKIDVLIFDVSGGLQLQQQFNNSSRLTIYHHLQPGMYTATIKAKDFVSTKKLVIQ